MENGSTVESASTEVSAEECEEDADSSQVTSASDSPPDPSKSAIIRLLLLEVD